MRFFVGEDGVRVGHRRVGVGGARAEAHLADEEGGRGLDGGLGGFTRASRTRKHSFHGKHKVLVGVYILRLCLFSLSAL